MKRDYKFLVLAAIVILAIAGILYFKDNGKIDEETAKCIAEKAVLYASKTCGHCAYQKQILGEYLGLFQIVECTENIEECQKQGIINVPAWIINNQKYLGAKTLKQLKELTKC